MTTEEKIRAEDPRLEILWVGLLPSGDMAIVREPDLNGIYCWPSYTAWRQPLPGAEPTAVHHRDAECTTLMQLSLF
jgi:hypothetical protein